MDKMSYEGVFFIKKICV